MTSRALLRARPWKRDVLSVLMVAGGIALVVVGHVPGVMPALLGGTVLVRTTRNRPGVGAAGRSQHTASGRRSPGDLTDPPAGARSPLPAGHGVRKAALVRRDAPRRA